MLENSSTPHHRPSKSLKLPKLWVQVTPKMTGHDMEILKLRWIQAVRQVYTFLSCSVSSVQKSMYFSVVQVSIVRHGHEYWLILSTRHLSRTYCTYTFLQVCMYNRLRNTGTRVGVAFQACIIQHYCVRLQIYNQPEQV